MFSETKGSASDWVGFSETNFIVGPEDTKKLTAAVEAPCNKEGEFDIKTTFTIGGEVEKYFEQTVDVSKINNLEVSHTNESEKLACQPHTFSLNVANTGSFTETYELSTRDNYAQILPDSFTLEEGDSQNVQVSYVRECHVYGEKKFSINVEAVNNDREVSVDLKANILQEYGFSFDGPTDVDACINAPTSKEYSITNDAHIANGYEIKLRDTSYAWLSGEYLELQPGQTGTFTVDFFPEYTFVEPGQTDSFEIVIESVYGDLEIVEEVNITNNDCYGVQVGDQFATATCRYDEYFPIDVENTGMFNETINLDIETKANVTYPTQIEVGPGQTKEVLINFNEDVEKSYMAKIIATVNSNFNTSDSEHILLFKMGDNTCYSFDVDPKTVNESTNTINITNDGLRYGEIDIEIYDNQNLTSISPNKFKLEVGRK